MQTHRQAAEQAIHLRRLLGRDYDPTYYRTRKKPDADGTANGDCEMNV